MGRSYRIRDGSSSRSRQISAPIAVTSAVLAAPSGKAPYVIGIRGSAPRAVEVLASARPATQSNRRHVLQLIDVRIEVSGEPEQAR
jgi:hypothetical protein